MPEDLPLEPDLIELLASDTRREILGRLKEERMTVTELARELDLRKATVHEHLKKLVEADVVTRDEDDRLWVYYDLAPRGKRMLNPNRTRFYLVVGVGVLAALVGAAALGAYLAGAGPVGPGSDMDPTAGEGPSEAARAPFGVTVEETEAVAGEPVTLETRVAGDASDVRAYLMAPEDAERLKRGDPGAEGIPLTVHAEENGDAGDGQARTRLSSTGPVPEGTYHVFVRTSAGEDNREGMPTVRVVGLEANVSPRTWIAGQGGAVTVDVTRDGVPVDGALVVEPTRGEGASLTARVAGGHASLPAERVSRLDPGEHRVRVQPDGRASWHDAGRLTVHEPTLAATPPRLTAGQPATLRVHATGAGDAIDAGPVTVDGARVEATRVLEDATEVNLTAAQPGPVTVETPLGSQTIEVAARAHATVLVEEGPSYTLKLRHANGTPAADAAVRLDGRGLGFTNDTGALAIDQPGEGDHRLAVQLASGATLARGLVVDGWDVSAVEPRVRLAADQVDEALAQVAVNAHLTASAATPVDATLTGRLDGRPVHAQALTLPPNATTTVRVDLPVADVGEHRVDLDVDAQPSLTVAMENRTPTDDDGTTGGGGDAEAEAPPPDGREVLTVGTDAAEAVDEELDAAPRTEPVLGTEDAADATDGAAGVPAEDEAAEQPETPAPGAAVTAAVLAGIAALVTLRRAQA